MTTVYRDTYKEYKHPERAALVGELLQNLGILEAPSDVEIQALLWLGNIDVLRRLLKQQDVLGRGWQRLEEGDKKYKTLEETEGETEEETEDEEDDDDEEGVEEEEEEK